MTNLSTIPDELELSQIKLIYKQRPTHIYFHPNNSAAENINYRSGVAYYGEKYKIHSDHGPAICYSDGSRTWMQNGMLHRWGGPAIEDLRNDVFQYWANNIFLTDEEFAECEEYNIEPISYATGSLTYVKRGTDTMHRELGPAHYGSDGSEYWVKDGILHRRNGPAVDRFDGDHEYWEDGRKIAKNNNVWPIIVSLAVAAAVGLTSKKVARQTKQQIQEKNK